MVFRYSVLKKQIAQLCQKDRTELPLFSNNIQLYLQNHKIAFFEPAYEGIRGKISALSKSFNEKNFLAEFHQMSVLVVKTAK